MVVKLWISYFQGAFGFSNIEIENYKSDELQVTIEIIENNFSETILNFQDSFFCAIKLPKNIPHHYCTESLK
jgi:hypothetical protein